MPAPKTKEKYNEWVKKLSLNHRGRQSDETKKKLSEILKGKNTWSKGSKLKPRSNEIKRKLSIALTGRKLSEEHRRKMKGRKSPNFWKGKKMSEETKRKMSDSHKGEKSYLWKGGITPLNEKIRHSFEYKFWRNSVFARDNYTCVWCGQKGGNLNADHIKPFAYFPESRFDIKNGRTLCVSCHRKTFTYKNRNNGGEKLKKEIQIIRDKIISIIQESKATFFVAKGEDMKILPETDEMMYELKAEIVTNVEMFFYNLLNNLPLK